MFDFELRTHLNVTVQAREIEEEEVAININTPGNSPVTCTISSLHPAWSGVAVKLPRPKCSSKSRVNRQLIYNQKFVLYFQCIRGKSFL